VSRSQHSERGAALLLVVVTIVVVSTAAVSLARIATTAKMRRRFDLASLMAGDLATQADTVARRFLAERAPSVVLPVDVSEPRVAVLADTWDAGPTRLSMTVTAFDLCGMIPLDAARDVWILRGILAPEYRRAVDRLDTKFLPRGLDQLGSSVPPIATFPTPREVAPSLGALISMHSSGKINSATAPMPLLDAAMRLNAASGLDAILAARSKNQMPTMPAVGSVPVPPRGSVVVVAGSDGWAVRVDLGVGPIRRSWWLVYQQTTASWKCVQRLAIP
jgi:hypothetical protein